MKDDEQKIKIITLGESRVGKTKILFQYNNKSYNENCLSTIGIEYFLKRIKYKDKKLQVFIFDTSGQERFRSIVSNYYKKTNGVILVYDISSEDSFKKIDYWFKDVNEKLTNFENNFILFGNKNDLESERQVPTEEGQALADKYGIPFLEGSAKTGLNIDELFMTLISNIMDKQIIDETKSAAEVLSTVKFKKRKTKCC